jgi:hypothetical protein
MKWTPIKDPRINQFGKQDKMNISLLAKLTFLGLAYIYTTKLIDTLYHGIFGAGAIGWFIMAAAQTLVVINYLSAGRLVWLADLFSAGPFVFVTVTSVTFLCLFVFYLTFARL